MVCDKFFLLLLYISCFKVLSGSSVNDSANETDQNYHLQPYNDSTFIVRNSGPKSETSQNASLGKWLFSSHTVNEILKNIKLNKSFPHRKREIVYSTEFPESTKRNDKDDYFTLYNGTINKKLNFSEYFEFMRQGNPSQEENKITLSVLSKVQNKSAKAIKELENNTVKPMPLLTSSKSSTYSQTELNESSVPSVEESENIANRTFNTNAYSKIVHATTRKFSAEDFESHLETSEASLSGTSDITNFNSYDELSHPYLDTTDIRTSISNKDRVEQYATHDHSNINDEFKNYNVSWSVTKDTKDIFDVSKVESYTTNNKFDEYDRETSQSSVSVNFINNTSISKLSSVVSTTLPSLTSEVENAVTKAEQYTTDHFRNSKNITEFAVFNSTSFFEKYFDSKYNITETLSSSTMSKFFYYNSSSSDFVNEKGVSQSSSTESGPLDITVTKESFDLPSTYPDVSLEVKVEPVSKREYRAFLTGIVLSCIGSLAIISVLIIVCYYCYNKKKKKTSYQFEMTSVKCDEA